eukprot:CAMPEP_0202920068 /NCGR_PEP_ID=MMETSP1392-20130828/76659_1 /ASSEMBLY_ACC=CAM_ASM_000868 /TAXON_ID=225041 /ORGANISM="Chlamydomonas chlamydogama, Strain SAG 11-48b" /LENGTH=598 /DNA_ID=CAMNT_0049613549 /DNA_START=180 /DNA_END=1976 /DNA_ORIENTATION=+
MTTDQPYITELRKLYELQPGLTREEFNNAKLVFARQSQEEQQVLLTGDNNEKLDYVRWLLERLQQPAIPPPPAPALQPAVSVSEDYVVVNRNGELLFSSLPSPPRQLQPCSPPYVRGSMGMSSMRRLCMGHTAWSMVDMGKWFDQVMLAALNMEHGGSNAVVCTILLPTVVMTLVNDIGMCLRPPAVSEDYVVVNRNGELLASLPPARYTEVEEIAQGRQQPAIPPPPAPALQPAVAVSEDYVVVNRSGELLASLPPARYTEVEEIINALVAQRHIHKDTQNNRRLTIDMPTPMPIYLAQYLEYGAEVVLRYHERHLIDAWRILAVSCKLDNVHDVLNERLGRSSSRPSTTTSGSGLRSKQLHQHDTSELRQPLLLNFDVHAGRENSTTDRRLTIDMPTPMSFYLAQYLKYGVEAVLGYHERHQMDAWRILAVSCKLGNLLDALNERLGRPSSRPSTTTSGSGLRSKQLHQHDTSELEATIAAELLMYMLAGKTAQRLAWVIRVVVLFLFGGLLWGGLVVIPREGDSAVDAFSVCATIVGIMVDAVSWASIVWFVFMYTDWVVAVVSRFRFCSSVVEEFCGTISKWRCYDPNVVTPQP